MSHPDGGTPPADPTPQPRARPRRPWVVALPLFVVLAAVLVGARPVKEWFDARAAERRLAATVESLRRSGAPVTLEDLAEPAVPDDENAVPLLRQAARALISRDRPEWQIGPDYGPPVEWPLEDGEVKQLTQLLELNREALEVVHRATERPRVAWGLKLRSPLLTMGLPDLAEQQQLRLLLDDDALRAHHAGDDAAALRDVREIIFIGRAVSRQPMLVSYLSGLVIESVAVARVSRLAPELRVAPAAAGVSRDEIKTLIDDLLDDRAMREALIRGLASDRVNTLDSIPGVLNGTFDTPGARGRTTGRIPWTKRSRFRDLVFSSTDLVLRQLTRQIEAAGVPTWPGFAARVPETPPGLPPDPSRYSLGTILLPTLHRANKQYYRALADHRLAATALAVRLYVLDHGGQFPKALKDLVPDYLSSVPLDPLSQQSAELRYLSDPQDPRVYSVGLNGIDNGGIEPGPLMSRQEYEKLADDVICHLKRQPRPRPVEHRMYPGLMVPGVPPGTYPGGVPGLAPPPADGADAPAEPEAAPRAPGPDPL